jgi:hypothetical protein
VSRASLGVVRIMSLENPTIVVTAYAGLKDWTLLLLTLCFRGKIGQTH